MTRVPLTKLKPASWNPREIRSDRFKNLCASIEADPGLLDLRPILATKDGTIYGGNHRYRAVQHLGWTDVPAELSDIPEQLAKERGMRDNGSWADWKDDDLGSLLAELKASGSDIDLLGFDSPELDRLLNSITQLPEEDEADLEPPVDPITKPGDLWLLGEHRLLCGDSTSIEAHDRVLNGDKVDLVLTDPPYGVGIDYGVATDTVSDLEGIVDDIMPLLLRWPVVLLTSGVAHMWLYPRPTWVLAWVHPAAMGPGPWGFNGLNPILAYGSDPKLKAGRGSFPDSLVLAADRKGVDGHPTPKPLEVWRWILERGTTGSGAVVFDPFMGSGTSIIACEQARDKCRGIELNPAYVDVTIARWEKLTNQKAVLDGAAHEVQLANR